MGILYRRALVVWQISSMCLRTLSRYINSAPEAIYMDLWCGESWFWQRMVYSASARNLLTAALHCEAERALQATAWALSHATSPVAAYYHPPHTLPSSRRYTYYVCWLCNQPHCDSWRRAVFMVQMVQYSISWLDRSAYISNHNMPSCVDNSGIELVFVLY